MNSRGDICQKYVKLLALIDVFSNTELAKSMMDVE